MPWIDIPSKLPGRRGRKWGRLDPDRLLLEFADRGEQEIVDLTRYIPGLDPARRGASTSPAPSPSSSSLSERQGEA